VPDWRVIMERPGAPPIVVRSHRKHGDAARHAASLANQYRFKGAERPRVFVQRAASSDQLQTYAHGERAVRDQPTLPAYGQDVVILAPTATRLAGAHKPKETP
jgi:hypothetical protein